MFNSIGFPQNHKSFSLRASYSLTEDHGKNWTSEFVQAICWEVQPIEHVQFLNAVRNSACYTLKAIFKRTTFRKGCQDEESWHHTLSLKIIINHYSYILLLLLLVSSLLINLFFLAPFQGDIGLNTSQDAPGLTRPKENTKASQNGQLATKVSAFFCTQTIPWKVVDCMK